MAKFRVIRFDIEGLPEAQNTQQQLDICMLAWGLGLFSQNDVITEKLDNLSYLVEPINYGDFAVNTETREGWIWSKHGWLKIPRNMEEAS